MGQYIVITLICVFIITVVGLCFGILMTKHVLLAGIVLRLTSFLYTIPSITLFGILVSISDIRLKSAVIAIVLYGLLPMVRNTYTGLQEVSPDVLEAAVGMGTTRWQFLWIIRFPLALRIIFQWIPYDGCHDHCLGWPRFLHWGGGLGKGDLAGDFLQTFLK